jgi:hypothetical protein
MTDHPQDPIHEVPVTEINPLGFSTAFSLSPLQMEPNLIRNPWPGGPELYADEAVGIITCPGFFGLRPCSEPSKFVASAKLI